MNRIDSFIKELQKRPYKTRLRILWGTTVAIALMLVIIWVLSIKKEVSSLDSKDLLAVGAEEEVVLEAKYSGVERIEQNDASLKIYFRVNNTENDILNFSNNNEVKLTVNNETMSPIRILDRQNKPFVQKILNKTENFGILIFPKIDAKKAQLVFENLYFETRPDNIFKESISLNIQELTKNQELRK